MCREQLYWPCPPVDWRKWKDAVHVWVAELDQPVSILQSLAQTLSPDELERTASFQYERHRQRFLVARGLLRTMLGAYLECAPIQLSFEYGPQGKPALSSAGKHALRFNVTHSEGLALYAVTSSRDVGVDLEQIHEIEEMEQLVRQNFSSREQETFHQLPVRLKQRAFFDGWTRKEAYLKATSQGFSLPPDQVTVSLLPGNSARLVSVEGAPNAINRWSLRSLEPAAGYAAALVVEGSEFTLACWRLEMRIPEVKG